MKLRPYKKIGICYPRDKIDWGYATLRREGDDLDDKEQVMPELDDDEAMKEDELSTE